MQEGNGETRVSVPTEDLRAAGLDPAFETLETAIANHQAGNSANVAVVADPFAGRDALLDYAESRLESEATRVDLKSAVTESTPVELSGTDDVLIVDDCQYLYRREIGGFDRLERFLEEISLSESLVITGWNRYAWDYLTAVKDVDRSFSVRVRIPELDADDIERLVETHHSGPMPEFTDTAKDGRIKTINVDSYPIRLWGDRTLDVPVLRPNTEWVSSWSEAGERESIEAVVFEKVRRVSHGNPGIATTVWNDSVTNDEVAPAYVRETTESVTLDEQQAYLLALIVSKESVDRRILGEVTDATTVEKALHTLSNHDIVTTDGESVAITPRGLHPAVSELRQRGLLW